jgi:chromosome segregation ATPase
MHYFISKIILYMLSSAAVGALLGYWLSRSKMKGEKESVEDWSMKYRLLKEEQNRQKNKFLSLRNRGVRDHDLIAKLKAEVIDLKERGSNISQQRDEFEIKYTDLKQSFEDDLKDKDDEYQNRQKQLIAATFKIKQLLQRVSMLSSEKKEARNSLESIQGERDQLSNQLVNLGGKGDDARNHLRLVSSKCSKLTQEIQVLNHEKESYEDRVDSLVKDQQILAANLAELKQERDDYMGRLRTISEVADRVGSTQ